MAACILANRRFARRHMFGVRLRNNALIYAVHKRRYLAGGWVTGETWTRWETPWSTQQNGDVYYVPTNWLTGSAASGIN